MKKAREQKENVKQAQFGGFMTDWVIKKSLIEREKEEAYLERNKKIEEELEKMKNKKGIVIAFDIEIE